MRTPFPTGSVWVASLVLGATLSGPAIAVKPGTYGLPPQAPALASLVPPLTKADLEQMALRGNPTQAQAAAAVTGSRGKALQAGLYPNPTVGYRGESIGLAGSAGEF